MTTESWNIWDCPVSGDSAESAQVWADHVAAVTVSAKQRTRELSRLRWLPWCNQSGARVLEVGCGNGSHVAYFLDQGLEYIGVDISARMVELARAAYPEVQFVRADGRHLPFADGQFDYVFCRNVLLHLPLQVEDQVVAECLRVAQHGAVIQAACVVYGRRVERRRRHTGALERYEVFEEELARMRVAAGRTRFPRVVWHVVNELPLPPRDAEQQWPGADVWFEFAVQETNDAAIE